MAALLAQTGTFSLELHTHSGYENKAPISRPWLVFIFWFYRNMKTWKDFLIPVMAGRQARLRDCEHSSGTDPFLCLGNLQN